MPLMNEQNIPTPCFVCDLQLLEQNLQLLKYIQDKANIKILLALKGFALKSSFDLCSKYLQGCCASGLNEAKLAKEYFKKEIHTYSSAFKPDEFDEIVNISDHIVFNSFSQLTKYKNKLSDKNSIGLRINPQYSTVDVALYDPCGAYSRLGITKDIFEQNIQIYKQNISLIEGFHIHALCEQNVEPFAKLLEKFEQNFGKYFKNLKWINFGGGHHITRDDYDIEGLIKLLSQFKTKYPHLQIYLEPGEAIGWQTGYLISTVLDIVSNGIDIAILDSSAEAHMPDTLAMPYKADIRGASKDPNKKPYKYRLAGNSCLAGDIMGDYSFNHKLQIGDKIIFEDMIHYTMVKTTTFNGINLPSIALKNNDQITIVSTFGYNDYKSRI